MWGVMGKRRPLFSAVAIGCAVLVASPSWAAVVQPGFGNLTINQGQGFKPVTAAVNANVGDSVMVGPGGSATVVYEDGCKVDIRPGAVTTIAPLSPCASGSNAQNYNNCPIGSDGRPHCEDDWGWAIGAGLLAIGLGVGIYEATKSNGTTTAPASP
jgi:hypothetical protein